MPAPRLDGVGEPEEAARDPPVGPHEEVLGLDPERGVQHVGQITRDVGARHHGDVARGEMDTRE